MQRRSLLESCCPASQLSLSDMPERLLPKGSGTKEKTSLDMREPPERTREQAAIHLSSYLLPVYLSSCAVVDTTASSRAGRGHACPSAQGRLLLGAFSALFSARPWQHCLQTLNSSASPLRPSSTTDIPGVSTVRSCLGARVLQSQLCAWMFLLREKGREVWCLPCCRFCRSRQ